MVDDVTRWKLQEVNLDADSFLILDSLYGNSNIYHLGDFVDHPKCKIKDVFVSSACAYILMSNARVIELNLLTKEITTIKESEYLEKSRYK